jgi:hypothetical protein
LAWRRDWHKQLSHNRFSLTQPTGTIQFKDFCRGIKPVNECSHFSLLVVGQEGTKYLEIEGQERRVDKTSLFLRQCGKQFLETDVTGEIAPHLLNGELLLHGIAKNES